MIIWKKITEKVRLPAEQSSKTSLGIIGRSSRENEQGGLKNIGRLMDISTVKTDVTFDEVKLMVDIVRKHHCICASPMPCFTKYTVDQLKDEPDIVTTGVVGFPDGAATTFIKSATTKELRRSTW